MGDLAGGLQLPVCQYCGFDPVTVAGAEAHAANRRRPGTDHFGATARRLGDICRAAVATGAIGQ